MKTQAIKKHDFAYSVALIRTLETLLLSENEVERMILSKDAKEAFKILNELDYSDNKAGIQDPSDFQQVINEGILDIKEILEKNSPNKDILNVLWLTYDFHNIKTMLKAKLSEQSFEKIENLLSKMGSIDIERLQKFIFDNENISFEINPQIEIFIKERIKRAIKLFEKEDQNPQVLDLYLDQKLIVTLRKVAKSSKNKFLIDYIKHYIDLSNIRLFFRMKSQKKDAHLFEIALMWNGHVDHKKLKSAYQNSLEDFVNMMQASPYAKIVDEGHKHFQTENSFIFLEKEIENFLTGYIKKAKYMAFGPEPLIGYFLAKKNNALIIRMILVNKLNKVAPEEIKSRLRNLYL